MQFLDMSKKLDLTNSIDLKKIKQFKIDFSEFSLSANSEISI